MSLENDVRDLVEPGWWPDFHGLRDTLAALPKPRREDDSRFIDLPPVYVVGNLSQVVKGQFAVFTGLNPNSAGGHRSALERPFDEYWSWCRNYFESADRSAHYRIHQAFLAGLLGDDLAADTRQLQQHAVAAGISGLASTNGWPEEQVRLRSAPNARLPHPQLAELRISRRHQTFGISARVFERLAQDARCIVARYEATRGALLELYRNGPDDESLRARGRVVPLFAIPNDGRSDPSVSAAFRMGRSASTVLRRWEEAQSGP